MIGSKYDKPTIRELLSSYSEEDQVRVAETVFRAMAKNIGDKYVDSKDEVSERLPPPPTYSTFESKINQESVNNINTMENKFKVTFKRGDKNDHAICSEMTVISDNNVLLYFRCDRYSHAGVIRDTLGIAEYIEFLEDGFSVTIKASIIISIERLND